MAARNTKDEEQISAVREFNRFYTARLGLLRKRHLDGDFSLTEARILYEIGAGSRLTASSLGETLGLNAGYVSRSLMLLTKRKLVRQTPSKQDGREKLLTLSPAGDSAVAWLNEQSARQIRGLLVNVNSVDRETLLDSLAKVRSILSEPKERSVRIVRLSKFSDDAIRLLQEYYEAASVVQRDTPTQSRRSSTIPVLACGSLIWIRRLLGVSS
jgi:DNA-binding MarR family transcriptional regulator